MAAAAAAMSPSRIAPPSSQTMNASSPSSESGSDSSSLDHSTRFSRASSASRNDDSSSPVLLRSEEYRQLFRLPAEEVLVQDFNCALQENILLQGHMYLFDHYLCFYSNIFGFETKKIIPFQEITSVRRAKTAGIFPNAIEIAAAGKKHFFASFLSRDEAFKLIADGWSQNGNGPKELLDRQDSKSEISSQLNGVSSPDSPASDYDSDERNLEVSRSRDTELSPDRVSDDGRGTAPEACNVVEEKQNALLVAEPSTSSQCRDAPEIPNGYTKVGESKFPINTEQFFNLFFSDDGFSFVESYHKACGDKDFSCTSWAPHDNFGYIREKSFQHPIKIYFGAKCGGCKETQKYQFYKNSHLVIRTSQEVCDVPYADYFTVEGLWDVQRDVDCADGCILRVYVTVSFSKRTIWKGKIEQSTMEECRETYATWIQLAHELLKQKNIEKTEAKDHLVASDKVDGPENGQNGEHADRVRANADSGIISSPVANPLGNHEETRELLQGTSLNAAAVISTVRAFAVRFCSSLKIRGNVKQFLVIAFSVILLLMQLSIVVLLSRPQQVYVIPQADHTTSVGLGSGQRAAEAMAWMEKRVHLLNDEMLAVEAQLERMRHEHIWLKTQLKDLERLTKRQR